VFALFPYVCLWQPPRDGPQCPPSTDELEEGWGRFGLKATESAWLPVGLMVASGFLMFKAFSGGVVSWNQYFKLFDESKFIHVMSLDFCALTALIPFFLWNDAEKRQWGPRSAAVPFLSCLPLLGPLIYLVLRPKAQELSD
jgi:hypothetical protein